MSRAAWTLRAPIACRRVRGDRRASRPRRRRPAGARPSSRPARRTRPATRTTFAPTLRPACRARASPRHVIGSKAPGDRAPPNRRRAPLAPRPPRASRGRPSAAARISLQLPALVRIDDAVPRRRRQDRRGYGSARTQVAFSSLRRARRIALPGSACLTCQVWSHSPGPGRAAAAAEGEEGDLACISEIGV